MKILELQLLAFGPFTGLTFDLADGNHGLHILFGPNEAGKSSALRALRALLYGIPHNCSDNFIHDNNKLRIGGRLRHSDGTELAFLRRKGNKNTLLGLDEKPLDDKFLDKCIQGVGEQLFSHVFGIDHEALVHGGKDILQGGGEVGESLFAAGLGVAGLRNTLQELDNEAGDLFRQRGQKQAINKAISDYNEAKRIITNASLSSREWSEHDHALKKAFQERDNLIQKLRQLAGEKNRLDRLQRALPKIAKREERLTRRNNLGDVVILPPEFPGKRLDTNQKLKTAEEKHKFAGDEIHRLKKEIQDINVPESLLDQSETIIEIHKRSGIHRKASQDLGKLQGNLRQLETDAGALLADFRRDCTLEQARKLRPNIAQRKRIQKSGNKYQALVDNLDRAGKDVQSTERELADTIGELEKLGYQRDPDRLRQAVARIQKRGDLVSEREQMVQKLEAEEEQSRIDLNKLVLWSGSPEELEQLPVPQSETVDRFESLFQDLSVRQKTLEGRTEEADLELNDLKLKIEELRMAGAVPSEEELAEARRRRNRGWKLVHRAWIEKEDVTEAAKAYDGENDLPRAYENSVGDADRLADRLRREANRVAEHASLIVRRDKREEDMRKLEEDRVESQKETGRIGQEWIDLWQPGGIKPLSPKEMRPWVVKQGNLIQRAERIRDYRLRLKQLDDHIAEHLDELNRCLDGLGETPADSDETLDILVERGRALVDRIEGANRRRRDLQTKADKLQNDLGSYKQIRHESADKLKQWQIDWEVVVTVLGLTGDILPDEANNVLGLLDELFKKLDKADGLEQRIYGIERDAEEYESDVKDLTRRLAPDLADLPVDQAAAQLNASLSKAQAKAVKRSERQQQFQKTQKIYREAESAIAYTLDELKILCEQAGCQRYDELEAVEERSSRFQALQKDIEAVEEQLIEIGGGTTLEQLLQEAEEVDADSLPANISEISRRIDELENERSRLNKMIWQEDAFLQQVDGSARAAEAAEKTQGILAEIRAGVERYIRLRMASIILRREIERYRAENQEPMLIRAGELFSRLTLGSFSQLCTDFNDKDEPVLLGARPSGEQVRVEGMSDGTRDQLYLSLRLASLEKYLQTNEPMPFIVDDILIKFDDQRAEATLKVLGDLSFKTQVIFFTHHRRLVELAEKVTYDKIVIIHEFGK